MRYEQLLQAVRNEMIQNRLGEYKQIASEVFPDVRSAYSWLTKAIDGQLKTPDPIRIERLAVYLDILDDEEQAAA